jgi:uncharacterized protein (TIGR03083 family)
VQISPVYGDDAVLRLDGVVTDAATPLLRQRDRLADVVVGLDEAQWAAQTRCEGWSVQDVIAHLTSTNQFWTASITAGAAGAPTRVLVDFDPVATPALLVDAVRSWTPEETLRRFRRSNDQLRAAVEALDDAGWSLPAEAPPGHIAIRLVALHALWDAWVHERDIALPLGMDPVVEADEVIGSLVYVAAVAPVFAIANGTARTGALEVVATGPDARFVVEVADRVVVHAGPAPAGAATVTGPAVELLEGLSLRAPFTPGVDEADRWLLTGLADVFDQQV